MSVKKLLAKQEEGFVSLHDVLTQMMADGSSYEEAATALYRLLRNGDEEPPQWWIKDALLGLHIASNKESSDAFACLVQATKVGVPPDTDPFDESDIPF